MNEEIYFCIDLKSFYASVECVERSLDPMTTNLVVADPERSEKTICLAVSPSLRNLGIKNRCRVFEIPRSIDYIIASPRMQKYIDYSANIYDLYLDYFSKEDIHVYSIDEVFINVTPYLKLYKVTPYELAKFLVSEIKRKFKIVATCGIGTNLYLAKIALDITAKHSEDLISFLDEDIFKKNLWFHRPITDFWRIGKGIAQKLKELGIETMYEITKANEDLLYEIFGIDAELLIDHAWGKESTTIEDIKLYTPQQLSFSNGQVLMRDYTIRESIVILREMLFDLALKLLESQELVSGLSLGIRYSNNYKDDNFYISRKLITPTDDTSTIIDFGLEMFKKHVNYDYKIRKITISFDKIIKKDNQQISFFEQKNEKTIKNSKNLNESIIKLKKRFGENSVLKGLDLLEEATSIERHSQIGGHKSGQS